MITAIILAAGESRRMGTPKPLLKFGEDTALSLAVKNCAQDHVTETIVVVGADAELIRTQHDLESVRFVFNDHYKYGRTTSLQAGLRSMSPASAGFLLYPCDHVLTTAADVHRLVAAFNRAKGASRIFIPAHDGHHGHPVLFDVSLREEFLKLGPDAPAHDVVHAHREETQYVPVDNPHIHRDMNTREEYEQLFTLFKQRL